MRTNTLFCFRSILDTRKHFILRKLKYIHERQETSLGLILDRDSSHHLTQIIEIGSISVGCPGENVTKVLLLLLFRFSRNR